MSPAAQAVLVLVAALVFLIRLAVALYHANVDAKIAAHRARGERHR